MSQNSPQALPPPVAGAWAGEVPHQNEPSHSTLSKSPAAMAQPPSSASLFPLPAALQGSVWASNAPYPPDVLDAALLAIQDAERAMQRAEAALQYMQNAAGSTPAKHPDTSPGVESDLATAQDFEDSAAAAATARKALDLARTEVLKAAQTCKASKATSSKDVTPPEPAQLQQPITAEQLPAGGAPLPLSQQVVHSTPVTEEGPRQDADAAELETNAGPAVISPVVTKQVDENVSQPVHILQQPLVAASAALAGSAAAVAAAAAVAGHSDFLESPTTSDIKPQVPAPTAHKRTVPSELELLQKPAGSSPAAPADLPAPVVTPADAAPAAIIAHAIEGDSEADSESTPAAVSQVPAASKAYPQKGAVFDIMQPLSSAAAALAAGSAYLASAIKPRSSVEALPTVAMSAVSAQKELVPSTSADIVPEGSPAQLAVPALPVLPVLPPEVANPAPEDPAALAAALEAVKKLNSPKSEVGDLPEPGPAAHVPVVPESAPVAPVDVDSLNTAMDLDVRSSHGSLRVPTLHVVDSMLFGPSETAGSTYSDADSEPVVGPSLSSSIDRSLKLDGAVHAGVHTKSSDHASVPSPIGTSEAEAHMLPTTSATSEDTSYLRNSAEGAEALSSGHAQSALDPDTRSQQNSGTQEEVLMATAAGAKAAVLSGAAEDSLVTDMAIDGSVVDEASSKFTPVVPSAGALAGMGIRDLQPSNAGSDVPAHADIVVDVASLPIVKSEVDDASKVLDSQGSCAGENQPFSGTETDQMLDTSVSEALGPVTPREQVLAAPGTVPSCLGTEQPMIIDSGVVLSPTVTAADQLPLSPGSAEPMGPEASNFLPPVLNTEEEGAVTHATIAAPLAASFAMAAEGMPGLGGAGPVPMRLASDLMSAKGSLHSRASTSADSQAGLSHRSFGQDARLSAGSVTSTPRLQSLQPAVESLTGVSEVAVEDVIEKNGSERVVGEEIGESVSEKAVGKEIEGVVSERVAGKGIEETVSERAVGKEIEETVSVEAVKPIIIAEPVSRGVGESGKDAEVAGGITAAESRRRGREDDKRKMDHPSPAVQLHHRQSSTDSHYMSADDSFTADQESSDSTVPIQIIPATDEHSLPDDWPSRLNDADLGEAAERLVIRAGRPMKMEAANISLQQLHPDTVNSINAIILQRLSHRQALAVIKEGYPYISAFDTAWTIMDFLPGEERDRNADSWSNEKQPAAQKQLSMRMLDSVSSKKMPLLAEKLAKKVPSAHSIQHANVVLGVLSDEQLSQVVQGMFEAMSVERLHPWCTRAMKDLSPEASRDFTTWVKRLRSWQPPSITVVADSLNTDAALKASLDPLARVPSVSPRITSSPRMSTVQEEDSDTSRLDQNAGAAKQAAQLTAAAAAIASSTKHVKFAETPTLLATPAPAGKPVGSVPADDNSIAAQIARLDSGGKAMDPTAPAATSKNGAEILNKGEVEKPVSSSTLSDSSVGNDWFLFPHVAGSAGAATPAIASGSPDVVTTTRAPAAIETSGSGTMIELSEAQKAKNAKNAKNTVKRKPRWFFCGCFASPDADEGSPKQKRVFMGMGSEPMSHSQVASHLSQATATSTNFAASPKKGFSQDTGAVPPVPEPPGTPSDRPDAESKLVVDSPIHDLANQAPTSEPSVATTDTTTTTSPTAAVITSSYTPTVDKTTTTPVQSASLLIARSKPLINNVQMAPVTASATVMGTSSFMDYKSNRIMPSRLTGKVVEDSPRVSSASTERILAGVHPFSSRQGSYESVVWPSTAAMGLVPVQSSEEEEDSWRCAYTEADLPGSLRQPRKPSAVDVIGSGDFHPSPSESRPEPELTTQQWDGTSKKWVWC